MSDPAKGYQGTSASVGALDLDAQIALAELAVLARDERVRLCADALVVRVKRDVLKHASGGALLALGTVGLTWWLNRLVRKNVAAAPVPEVKPSPEPPSSSEHVVRDVGFALAGLLPMVWPLLPRSWRRLVSPATAGTLITSLTPLLGRLFRRRWGRPSFR